MAGNLRKVLIVEDSPTMRKLYGIVLAREADRLIFAANGVEGLDRAAQEPDVDLMIVDINMPQMDGLEFLRRTRGELGLAAPAIVVSTEGQPVDREAAAEAGANGYLRKPWTPEMLMEAIRALPEASAT